MAGYIGSKTVNLSTTGADIAGDADVSGALDVGGAFTSQGIDDNATSTAMTLDASGNVGIGTAAPAYHLHLNKNTDDDGLFIGSTSNTENKRIVFGTAGSIGKAAIATLNEATFGRKSLNFYTNSAGDNTTDIDYANPRMVITNTGNVGIGLTGPSSILQLAHEDPELYSASSVLASNARLRLRNSSATTGSYSALTLQALNDSGSVGTWNIISLATTNNYDNHLVFHTRTGASTYAERMRINSSGNLIVGSDNSTQVGYIHKTYINFTGTGASYAVLGLRHGSTATRRQINFMNPNGIVGRIQTSGSATSYVTSSDYRLKENVVDITDGIERVKQLSPKRFNFIADADLTVDGFIAHETQTVVPEAIDGVKDETQAIGNLLDANGTVVEQNIPQPEEMPEGNTWTETGSEPVYQGIDQSKLVPLLTAALQEALTKIDDLETRLTALEAV